MTFQPYADEPYPGELLVCRRPPCHGRVYHDQAWHDWMSHGGPRPPGASTTPFDVDPRWVDPDPEPVYHDHYQQRAERIAWVLIALVLLAIFAGTIALVWNRPPA